MEPDPPQKILLLVQGGQVILSHAAPDWRSVPASREASSDRDDVGVDLVEVTVGCRLSKYVSRTVES